MHRLFGAFEDRGLLTPRVRRLVILNADALHRPIES